MAAPKGNNNAAKAKVWSDAIRRAIARASGDGRKIIDDAADSLVAQALLGDVPALKELGDRVEGKVAQPIGGTDDLPPIRGIEVTFVRAEK